MLCLKTTIYKNEELLLKLEQRYPKPCCQAQEREIHTGIKRYRGCKLMHDKLFHNIVLTMQTDQSIKVRWGY
jgi:hypothetical protein